tara:strand:+ start:191 stop:382 length:192 start_codon:yes stop_codon:yes gene_type:complete
MKRKYSIRYANESELILQKELDSILSLLYFIKKLESKFCEIINIDVSVYDDDNNFITSSEYNK